MVDGFISFLFNSSFVFSLGKKSREFSSEMDLWLVPCGGAAGMQVYSRSDELWDVNSSCNCCVVPTRPFASLGYTGFVGGRGGGEVIEWGGLALL